MDTDYYLGRVVSSSVSSIPGFTVKQRKWYFLANTRDAVIMSWDNSEINYQLSKDLTAGSNKNEQLH